MIKSRAAALTLSKSLYAQPSPPRHDRASSRRVWQACLQTALATAAAATMDLTPWTVTPPCLNLLACPALSLNSVEQQTNTTIQYISSRFLLQFPADANVGDASISVGSLWSGNHFTRSQDGQLVNQRW
jgi:hypothetical protein